MTWERALEADARLAAKNAVLIRAALRQSFDPERAFIGYRNTMPDENLTLPQQRVRARAWTIMNIRPNLEPLREVLYRVWAQGYVLGDTAAREAIEEARLAQKADTITGVDWSKWKPGDAVAALLLKPPKSFQRLLTNAGITLKGFSDTTLTDIGNAIGEAIELGLDAKTSAKNIMNYVANPARALSIAITEQNRAISTATQNRYLESGLEKNEWLVFQPCDICAKNAGQVVSIGAPFPSGDTQPPAHPHCRCALAPVIPDFDDPANTAGSITVTEPSAPASFAGRNIEAEFNEMFATDDLGRYTDKTLMEEIEAMDLKDRTAGGYAGDNILKKVVQMQGFDGKPTVVETIDDVKNLAKTTPGRVLYRGIADYSQLVSDAGGIIPLRPTISYSADRAINDFISGDYRAGWGVFGSGTYSTETYSMATGYALSTDDGAVGSGAVMAMFLPDSALMPSKEEITALKSLVLEKDYMGDRNIGRILAARGYQAYDVGLIDEDKKGIYVILDRTAVTVSKERKKM